MISGTTKLSNKSGIIPAFSILVLFSVASFGQDLPDRIRGHKVYSDKVSVNASTAASDAAINIGEPAVVDMSLTGITLELPAEFTSSAQSGKVEMVSFHDLKVNGIKVEPEEYAHKFEFRKGQKLRLPNPIRIFIPASGLVKAAWQQMTEKRTEWIVTGRIFVFGKFRRFGIHHKRVVPIDLNLTIKNPLQEK
ncbi:MAG: hypothetical protein PSX80_05730 [bacterium]|nr:hypothetical protein [bacterium]